MRRLLPKALEMAPGYVLTAAIGAATVWYLPSGGGSGQSLAPMDPPARQVAISTLAQDGQPEVDPTPALADLLGVVAAAETVDLVAPREGRLVQAAAVGERVVKGGLVAEISVEDLTHRRRAQAARVHDAELSVRRLRFAELTAERRVERRSSSPELFAVEQLEESRLEHESALLELESARARRTEAAAELALLDEQIARQRIVAPIDGLVAARWVDPGATVAAGQLLAQLVSTSHRIVRFAAPAGSHHSYQVGTAVTVSTADVELVSCGVVEKVSPTLDLGSRFVFVEARLADRHLEHLPFGSAVRVRSAVLDCGSR